MSRRRSLLGLVAGALLAATVAAGASEPPDLYRATVIVTGQGERNRELGFRECLDEVLVRVSGDHALMAEPAVEALRERAGDFVASFRYRDRLEGVPIHDEQGTYDRPHDLTCLYEPAVVDDLLLSLGSRPWRDARPTLAVFLRVENGAKRFALARDGAEGPYMRDSFALAAEPLAIGVVFPDSDDSAAIDLRADGLGDAPPEALAAAAARAGGEKALAGSIVWSDRDLGWVADWRLDHDGTTHRWQVRGVSFDEAFRVALRGAARVLSGNGSPG